MWKTRKYAQLEKCTEAAALRSAFPEEIGNDYIGEEGFNNENIKDVTPSKTADIPDNLVFEDEPTIEQPAEETKTDIVEKEPEKTNVNQVQPNPVKTKTPLTEEAKEEILKEEKEELENG